MAKKINTKNKKGKNGKKSTTVAQKDPIAVRVLFSFFMLFMILTFVIGAVSIVAISDTNSNQGVFKLGDKSYTTINEYNNPVPNTNGGIFNSAVGVTNGVTVGFKSMCDGKSVNYIGKVNSIESGKLYVTVKDGEPALLISANAVIGVYEAPIDNPLYMSFITSPFVFLIVFVTFVACTFVLGLIYYLVSPRGAKQLESKSKKNEETVVQTVTTISSENSELLSHYLSTDDNIQPLDPEQNEVGALLNINYYNSVRLHNGEVYAVVKKYAENARRLEEYGASDMDIIRMNMIGNSEFDDLILNTHKEKSMDLWEIIDFANTLEGVYCVKKRGTLNWTYKYKSKTLFIVKRENDDSDSFKVSIKIYPDAANKLNIIYKALEDSSFPNGPYWYMFNDLRNLPANVIKWLMTESLNISKWQQTKADLLRESPTLASYKLDVDYMHDMVLANTKMFDMGKFIIITQSNTEADVRHNTVLETGFDDINMDEFTKEISMAVPNLKNVQMSILTRKNASEALVGALCDELLDFKVNNKENPEDQNPNDLNSIAKPTSTTKFVRNKKKK